MLTLNRTVDVWKVVLARLRRKSISREGMALSERDHYTYTEAIVLCSLHLIDLSSRYGGIGSQRDIITWATKVVSLDVMAHAEFLSDAIVALRNVVAPMSFKEFKRSLARSHPFVGWYFAPIRGSLESFLENPTADGFYVSYQFLSFLTHLTLLDVSNDLETEYEELELHNKAFTYDPSMVREMNLIMRDWMKDFSINEDSFFPAHGPGAIAEQSATDPALDKYRFLGTDPLITYVFAKFCNVDVTSYFPFPPQEWVRKSKIVFVPKSMKTRRVISKEPASLMYLQQGVSRCLVKYIHSHGFLHRHIDLEKQHLNARLAISSSLDQMYSTIDLSSASDRVTSTLVKAVFRGTPVYPFLVALRSTTAELPSGKVLELEKYAPMGSALCFPIQTLIFSCAIEYAVRRAQRTFLGYYPKWRVYGDDIIVQTPVFQDVLLVLGRLGFKLNLTKSFTSPTRFRESCGGEGYDGVPVVPLKISRRFLMPRGGVTGHHAALHSGLIDLANQAYLYQFPLLRAWVIRVLLECSIAPPLFSGTVDGTLYSPWPDNYRAPSRFNKSLQRCEVRVAQGRTIRKSRIDPMTEHARYFETLRLSCRRTGDMFEPEHRICIQSGTVVAKLRKTWVLRPW